MASDFSNQNIIADDSSDRMVLSQFGYDGSDEGFGAGEATLMRGASRNYTNQAPNPHCHPMSGFEGLFDDIGKTLKQGLSSAKERLIGTAKDVAAKQLSAVTSKIVADPRVQEAAKEQAKQQAAQAVAQKLVQAGEQAAETAKAAVETVKSNKLPIALLVGGALAAYFLFMRKK